MIDCIVADNHESMPSLKDCDRCPGCGGMVVGKCKRCRAVGFGIRLPQPGVFSTPMVQVLGEGRLLSTLERRLGILVLGDLLHVGADKVSLLPGIGPKLMKEIRDAVGIYGFEWQQESKRYC